MKYSSFKWQVLFLMMMLFTSITVFSQGTTTAGYYTPKLLNIDVNEAKSNLTKVLSKTLCAFPSGWFWNSHYPTKVEVFDDRFEIIYKKENITFYFTQLLKYDVGVSVFSYEPGMIARDFYVILFDNVQFFSRESDVENIKELADYLYFFQNEQKKAELKEYEVQLALFESAASKYRALQVKPSISEEQRKYIVQANGFTEMKEYNKATELYKMAIKVNPTSYPAAYSNLALLAAQINDYSTAIFYMKKYLMLVPEAEDARSAQDKIYLWEAQMEQ